MNKLTTQNHSPSIYHSIQYYCDGMIQVRKNANVNQELVIKLHDGLAKVIAGQLRILNALNLAARA